MEPVCVCSFNPATKHHHAPPSVRCAAAAAIGEANGVGEVGWLDDVALGIFKKLWRDENGQVPPLSGGGAAKVYCDVELWLNLRTIHQSSDDKSEDGEALLVSAGLMVTKAYSFAPALREILLASKNLATAYSA
uniref:Uncharacterized protein n=1 Tax=Oryza nivara TaxID=4536 RepID=A0A0E0GY29_ORYNI